MKLLNKRNLLIGLVILIILFTRFFFLDKIPRGLYIDEASFLLNSVSILESGKDEDNRPFPLLLESNIDSKPALYSYLQIPFIYIFGQSVFVSRLPSFFLSLVSIVLLYYLSKKWLSKNHQIIFFTLLLLSPWHIVISRGTQEVILSFVFFLLAIIAFEKVLKNIKRRQKYLWILIFLITNLLAMYSYHSYKIFLPLLFIGWSVIVVLQQKNNWKRNYFDLICLSLIPLLLSFLIVFISSDSTVRFKTIGFFVNQEPQLILDEQIRTATGYTSTPILRLFYNKLIAYSKETLNIYLKHFSVAFLFFDEAKPIRYLVPFQGLLYMIEIILLPLGFILSTRKQKLAKYFWFVLWWSLVAPIPAALTFQEIPSSIRSFPLLIPILIWISSALELLWKLKKNLLGSLIITIVGFIYIYEISYFIFQLGIQQAQYHPWERNRADEKLAQYLIEVSSQYENVQVYIDSEIYTYIALQSPSFRKQLRLSNKIRHKENFSIGNYNFFYPTCDFPLPTQNNNDIFIFPATCKNRPGLVDKEKITFDDGVAKYMTATFDYKKAQETKINSQFY